MSDTKLRLQSHPKLLTRLNVGTRLHFFGLPFDNTRFQLSNILQAGWRRRGWQIPGRAGALWLYWRCYWHGSEVSVVPYQPMDERLHRDSFLSSNRRLLAKVHLPKESQQIDRALEAFAKYYHKCNSDLADSYGIAISIPCLFHYLRRLLTPHTWTKDSAYAMAFSILLLHTDAHNKNVKRKMNRDTFIMRTRLIEGGENIPAEILDVRSWPWVTGYDYNVHVVTPYVWRLFTTTL